MQNGTTWPNPPCPVARDAQTVQRRGFATFALNVINIDPNQPRNSRKSNEQHKKNTRKHKKTQENTRKAQESRAPSAACCHHFIAAGISKSTPLYYQFITFNSKFIRITTTFIIFNQAFVNLESHRCPRRSTSRGWTGFARGPEFTT